MKRLTVTRNKTIISIIRSINWNTISKDFMVDIGRRLLQEIKIFKIWRNWPRLIVLWHPVEMCPKIILMNNSIRVCINKMRLTVPDFHYKCYNMILISFLHHSVESSPLFVHYALLIPKPNILSLFFPQQFKLTFVKHILVLSVTHRHYILSKISCAYINPNPSFLQDAIHKFDEEENISYIVVMIYSDDAIPAILMGFVQRLKRSPGNWVEIWVFYWYFWDYHLTIGRIWLEEIWKIVDVWVNWVFLLVSVEEVFCTDVVLGICLVALQYSIHLLFRKDVLQLVEKTAHSAINYEHFHLTLLPFLTALNNFVPMFLNIREDFFHMVEIRILAPLASHLKEQIFTFFMVEVRMRMLMLLILLNKFQSFSFRECTFHNTTIGQGHLFDEGKVGNSFLD